MCAKTDILWFTADVVLWSVAKSVFSIWYIISGHKFGLQWIPKITSVEKMLRQETIFSPFQVAHRDISKREWVTRPVKPVRLKPPCQGVQCRVWPTTAPVSATTAPTGRTPHAQVSFQSRTQILFLPFLKAFSKQTENSQSRFLRSS